MNCGGSRLVGWLVEEIKDRGDWIGELVVHYTILLPQTSNTQHPLCNPLAKRIHILPTLAQDKLERLHPRLAIIAKPIPSTMRTSVRLAQRADIVLDHALTGCVFLEPQNLPWVELEMVFNDVVVGDVVAPAFGAGIVGGVEGVFGRGGGVAGQVGGCVVHVGGHGSWSEWVGRWVVEVDVVEEGAVFVGGVSSLELAGDGAVGGADVGVNDLAEDTVDVCYFGKLPRVPVVQECGALEEDEACGTEFAWVIAVVEGAGVEPVAIDGSAYAMAFLVG